MVLSRLMQQGGNLFPALLFFFFVDAHIILFLLK